MPSWLVLLQLLLCSVIAAMSLVYLFLRKWFSYWADRGVVHDPPLLFYGNLKQLGISQTFREPFYNAYMKYKRSAPFAGFYLFMRRAVILLDLELVKHVLIKDFTNFANRGNYYNEKDEPLSAHLFNLDGPQWRSMRAKLTPTFTTGKMKFMFPTIVEVADKFVIVLKELLEAQTDETAIAEGIEIKELLARFTTDVIGTCAFGLECNSLRDPEAKFRLMGKKLFKKRRHGKFVNAIMNAFPDFARKLRLKSGTQDVHDFFMGVVRETVAYREKEHVQRNDFMNLLIELKNNNEMEGLTLEQIAAQAFVFFIAGFETSSSSMSFVFYELAVNQGIQDKVRAEIEEVFERHGGEFTYESMREMKYLYQVLRETMRKYSIATVTVRKTINDYKVPNTNFILEKGVIVIIPIDAIHRDPDIYPNPELFDPERFAPGEEEKRHAMSWLPFGDGPRNCIGQRFGEMQAMVGLVKLLKNFRFSTATSTKIPLEIEMNSFLLASKGGFMLKVESL